MTVEVKKKLPRKEVKALLSRLKKAPKVLDAKKYFGKARVEGDPLKTQRLVRDE